MIYEYQEGTEAAAMAIVVFDREAPREERATEEQNQQWPDIASLASGRINKPRASAASGDQGLLIQSIYSP
eukprot:scaffold38102_cov40-Cyclotella_meneghiniana.AAC.6